MKKSLAATALALILTMGVLMGCGGAAAGGTTGNVNTGVYVESLKSNVPDGVKTLDCIAAVDGTHVTALSDFKQTPYAHEMSDTLTLTLYRIGTDGQYARQTADVPVVQYLGQ